jgi:hypothetical protein
MKVKRNAFAVVGWVAWNLVWLLGIKYVIDKLTGRDHHAVEPDSRSGRRLERPVTSRGSRNWRRRRDQDDTPN